MNGLSREGITIYIGKLPYRKQQAVYFIEGTQIIPIAYVSEKALPEVIRLWKKFLGDK